MALKIDLFLTNGIYRDCELRVGTYGNGRIAVTAVDQDDERVAVLTVNVPTVELLDPDNLIIKDYSENEGVLDSLRSAQLVVLTSQVHVSGFVSVQEVIPVGALKDMIELHRHAIQWPPCTACGQDVMDTFACPNSRHKLCVECCECDH